METKCPSSDDSDFVVESFDDAIGQAELDVGEDVVLTLTNCSCCFDEGPQPRAGSPSQPILQAFLCPFRLFVVKGLGEEFFEHIPPEQLFVVLLDFPELEALVRVPPGVRLVAAFS